MKRLWVAVGILATVITLCIGTLLYQRYQVTALLDLLDDVIVAHEKGSAENAHALAVTFTREFDNRTRFFSCFMSHNDLTGCRESVMLLPAILQENNVEEFRMESTRCRAQLEHLLSIETPTLQNIL